MKYEEMREKAEEYYQKRITLMEKVKDLIREALPELGLPEETGERAIELVKSVPIKRIGKTPRGLAGGALWIASVERARGKTRIHRRTQTEIGKALGVSTPTITQASNLMSTESEVEVKELFTCKRAKELLRKSIEETFEYCIKERNKRYCLHLITYYLKRGVTRVGRVCTVDTSKLEALINRFKASIKKEDWGTAEELLRDLRTSVKKL